MASRLARAHIEAERRLRVLAGRGVRNAWRQLPSHDEGDVDAFLARALPIVRAAQRQSITITDAYLARALGRTPLGLNAGRIIAASRNGTPAEEVYRRPFVTLWSKLGEEVAYEQALAAATARLVTTAETDVQLAMRDTLAEIARADDGIYGYQRVANAGACPFCLEVDGAYVKGHGGIVMELHPACGCGVEPLTEPHRAAVELPAGDQVREYQYGPTVAVREHGELGPMLGDANHDFTSETDI